MFEKIENIIFDLGGVIFDLNYLLTERAFENLGAKEFGNVYSQAKQQVLFDDWEKGKIQPHEFRQKLNTILNINVSDDHFDNAWNAMLLGWPKEKLDFIQSLKGKYRLFLLSNTNVIHFKRVFEMLKEQHGLDSVDSYFEKTYYSHLIHKRKPDAAIFKHVIRENNLDPAVTLFIDDSIQHVEGGQKARLNVYHLKKGQSILELGL